MYGRGWTRRRRPRSIASMARRTSGRCLSDWQGTVRERRAGDRRGPEELGLWCVSTAAGSPEGVGPQVTIEDDGEAMHPCTGADQGESMDFAQSAHLKTIAHSKSVLEQPTTYTMHMCFSRNLSP